MAEGGRRVRARSESSSITLEDAEYLDKLEAHGFSRTNVRVRANTQMVFLGTTTPFAYFCLTGDLDMVRWLFAHGAASDCSVKTESGLSPLTLACRAQHLPLVRWLLSLGVDIDEGGGPWTSPLCCATLFCEGEGEEWPSCELPLLLLDAGAETRSINGSTRRTVFHVAAENGLVPLLEKLHSTQLADDRELRILQPPGLQTIRTMDKESFLDIFMRRMEGMTSLPAHELQLAADEVWNTFSVALDTDIRAVDRAGYTPLRLVTCPYYIGAYFPRAVPCRLAAAKWLLMQGALSGEDGHCDPILVRRDMTKPPNRTRGSDGGGSDDRAPDIRPALLEWARGVTADHRTFLHVVLKGTCSQRTSAHIWKLNSLGDESSSFLKRTIAGFLGIECGRRLRTVREFGTALGDIDMDEEGPLTDVSDDEDGDDDDDDDDDDHDGGGGGDGNENNDVDE